MASPDLRRFLDLTPHPVLIATRSGVIVAANAPMASRLSLSVEQLRSSSLFELASTCPEAVARALRACARSRAPIPIALLLRAGSGDQERFMFRGALLEQPDDGAAHVVLQAIERPRETGPFHELTRHIADLQHEVRQRRRAEAELLEAHARAESASRAKGDFLANMSHEIRTPMTAILGYAYLLIEHGDLSRIPLERREAIDGIKRNGEHLLRLVNDVLDLSKIEAGQLAIEDVEFPLLELLADLQSFMAYRVQEKGLELSVECIGAIPETLRSDPTRVRQILLNLLSNAIKFTERGAVRIAVRVVESSSGPKLAFDVRDTGIGISAGSLLHMFQPFTQADSSTTRRFGGTGLGLTICRRLASCLGAEIEAQSEPGRGSCFRLLLPLHTCAHGRWLDDVGPELESIARKRANQAARRPRRIAGRVLLAEDGIDNQRVLRAILSNAGAEVVVADDGQRAVDLALEAREKGEPFGLILMDMQMPVLDGYDATRALRRAGYDLPIAALTANALSTDADKCRQAGCDDFATKPIDRENLLDLLSRYLDERPTPD